MDSIVLVAETEDSSGAAGWLRSRLQGAGYEVWLAEYDLPAGTVIGRGLEKAIVEHDLVLLMVEQTTVDSQWTGFQSDLALHSKEKIIPIAIDNAQLPPRFQTRQSVAMRGPDDWRALHRLVNDLGGEAIPRVVNLSGRADLQATDILVLADIAVPAVDLARPDSLIQVGTELGRSVLPYLNEDKQTTVGLVPPGLAPLAAALLAYLIGHENQLPHLFWPFPSANGRFGISGSVTVDLQRSLRNVGIAEQRKGK